MTEALRPNAPQTIPRDHRAPAVLEAISRAYHASVLYGEEHPSRLVAAREVAEALAQSLVDRPQLRFGVAGRRFLLDDEELPETEALRSLVTLFVELEVAAIELRPGLTAVDVVTLVDLLRRGKRARQSAAELQEDLRAQLRDKVRIIPMDFSVLRSADGADSGAERQAVSWADLARVLMTPGSTVATSDPDALAGLANAVVNPLDAPGVDALRRRLQFAAKAIDGAPRERQPEVLGPLRAFVANLSPDLRDALLRLDIDRPHERVGVASEIAHVWPMGEVLQALDAVDRNARTTSDEALLLFCRLATITVDDPRDSGELASLARDWGSHAESPGGATELLRSLSTVLESRQRTDFTPDNYRQQLEDIAVRIHQGREAVDVTDATDPVHTMTRTSKIAIEMLGDVEVVEGHVSKIGEYLESSLPELIERGQLDVVWDAMQAAVAVEGEDRQAPRAVARRFLDEVTAQAPNLASPLRRLHEVPEEVAALLRHLGSAAVEPILAALVGDLDPEVRRTLLEIASSTGAELLAANIRDLARSDCNAVQYLAPLIERLPFDKAIALVVPVLQEGDADARRVIFEMLTRVCWVWPPRLLRWAITDEDEGIQALAIRHMREQDDSACIALMSLRLAGRLVERPVSPKLFDLTLEALTESKRDERLAWLSALLRILGKSPRAVMQGWPQRVAAHLRTHRAHKEARRALWDWRFAPMRYARFFIAPLLRRQGDPDTEAATSAP